MMFPKKIQTRKKDARLTVPGGVTSSRDDNVGGVLLEAVEEFLDDGLGAIGVALLGVEGRSGVVGDHAVPTTQGVGHGAPRVVAGSGLDVP